MRYIIQYSCCSGTTINDMVLNFSCIICIRNSLAYSTSLYMCQKIVVSGILQDLMIEVPFSDLDVPVCRSRTLPVCLSSALHLLKVIG